MKKLSSIFVVALMAVSLFSCDKKEDNVVVPKQYVETIAGSFIAQDGDIVLKDAPIGATRTWTMYAKNSPFYGYVSGPDQFGLVDGREFITGSVAYNFWSNSANNPVSFGAGQQVYSNLTPDENLRLISESKVAGGAVAFLGILDFNPGQANFPLTINCFRLGDVLKINTDALTSLPGGDKLSISVVYNLAPINLAATKLAPVSAPGGTPNGLQFQWSDIVYGTSVASTANIGSGDYVVYEGLDKKVMGQIVITIADNSGNGGNGSSTTITKTVNAAGPGSGLKLTLTTTKVGWYDSQTITFSDQDITVTAVNVPVN